MDEWSRTTPEMLTALADVMRGRVVDGIAIHDTHAELHSSTDGEVVVRLTAVIDDTPVDVDPWPTDALLAIDEVAQREAYRLGIEELVYVRHRRIGSMNGRRLADQSR